MSTDQKTSSISIIIPTRNESGSLGNFLPPLIASAGVEVIVADGGSSDNTVDTAKSLGAVVLNSLPGRAVQMNEGARAAHGEILLFLHADTKLAPDFAKPVHDTLSQSGVVAGAFKLAIDGAGIGLRTVEWLANFRSRFWQMPYGDQGIFLSAQMFAAVGGFPDLPIMEDFELLRRLRKIGRIRILPLPATTSARRWQKLGVLRTTLINQAIICGYLLGVNPEKLAEWYRKG